MELKQICTSVKIYIRIILFLLTVGVEACALAAGGSSVPPGTLDVAERSSTMKVML